MNKITIDRAGQYVGASSLSAVIRALACHQCNTALKAANVTALTGNTGGTALTVITLPVTPANNENATGAVLAPKAASETAFAAVRDALSEILAKAKLGLTALGIESPTDGSGAPTPDGAVGAINPALTGATTGLMSANVKPVIDGLNAYVVTVAHNVSRLAAAVGSHGVGVLGDGLFYASAIPTVPVAAGTAAAGGVLATDLSAVLKAYQDAAATLQGILSAALTVDATPPVVAGYR